MTSTKRPGVAPPPGVVRTIDASEAAGFDTRRHLENARRQAEVRGLQDILVVDVDAHHDEGISWRDFTPYIEDPVLRHLAERKSEMGAWTGDGFWFDNQPMAGRLPRYPPHRETEVVESEQDRQAELIRREMTSIGIDYQIVFPTPMLSLGIHPNPEIEVALSWAYTRWFVEEVMPRNDRIRTMVYLPFNDPKASLRAVEAFSDRPGVVGFMVTAARYRPVHHNDYAAVYRALEERDMPLGFHAVFHTNARLFEGMNRFISVHSLGFILPNFVHMINLVINGIPERFPRLKFVWIENGLAWLPFLMQRLDNEYMMRTSEAPLLRKLPSEYMKEMYYSTQPMESHDLRALETTMLMMNAETQLMFASDYPHWDFNLPSTIYDLPFLSREAKLNILGRNAWRVFRMGSGGDEP